MAQVPSPSFNYGYDAVARSSGVAPLAMFAPSGNNNVANVIVCPVVSLTVPNAATDGTLIPTSVFSAGPGFYWLNLNANGDNDIQSLGYVTFLPSGAYGACTGFFTQVNGAFAPVTAGVAASPYQKIHLITTGGIPPQPYAVNQTGGDLTYAVTAVKIGN